MLCHMDVNDHTIGALSVARSARLGISNGTVTGNVTVAKAAVFNASELTFEGTVNCNGNDAYLLYCTFTGTLNIRGSHIAVHHCTLNGTLNVSGDDVAVNAGSTSGKITVNNGGMLRFVGDGGKYGEILVKAGGTMKVYGDNAFTGKTTVESGSILLLAGGTHSEVLIHKNVDFTLSGGEFTRITVVGKKLIDYIADGKALEDMNNGFIIDGRVGIAGDVKVVEHTHTCIWKTDTHEKLCGCGYVEAIDNTLPVINGLADQGIYWGDKYFTVTEANEYTVLVDGQPARYTDFNGERVYVIPAQNEFHTVVVTDIAGNSVSCYIGVFKIYTVTLPTGEGYTTQGAQTVNHGTAYTFTVTIANGYSMTEGFVVKANGMPLAPLSEEGNALTYAMSHVNNGDQIITVEGVADITAPNAQIEFETNSFNSFLNRVTFGLFFKKTVTVTVSASDAGSGLQKIEYLLSETAFADVDSVTGDWVVLTLENGKAEFSIEPNRKAYIYVRVIDASGNIGVINSEGIVAYTDSEALTDASANTELSEEELILPKLAPEIIEGMNGEWMKNTNQGLSFRSNAAFADFLEVLVDGKLLDASQYDVQEGSIRVTLKPAFLETLSVGRHTLTVRSAGGEATAHFLIKAYQPGTGDGENLTLWIAVFAVSGTAALCMGLWLVLRRKRRN